MAKEGGLGMSVAVDDSAGTARTISNNVTSVSWETPREVWEFTGIDKSAVERTLLLADFSTELTGAFDDAANMSHSVFRTVPSTTTARTTTIGVSGQTLAGELLYSTYSLERSDSGELTWTAEGSLADGTVPTWT